MTTPHLCHVNFLPESSLYVNLTATTLEHITLQLTGIGDIEVTLQTRNILSARFLSEQPSFTPEALEQHTNWTSGSLGLL